MNGLRNVISRAFAMVVGVATGVACSGAENGKGTVTISTWGEAYIEEGLPSDAFPHDHWSVKYSQFLVLYDSVSIADEQGHTIAELDYPLVFDMTKKSLGAPKTLVSFELEAKAWPNLSYQVGPYTDAARPGDLATSRDVERLAADRASVHVEGRAVSPEGLEKTFSWSFAPATRFEGCHGEQDGRDVQGVFVTNGGQQMVELTVHGDHLFYDDLQAGTGAPRFQALADADVNGDGEVTLAELDQVPLYTIPIEKGTYGTGALGNVNTLGDYQRTLARTIGHFRGEGSCHSKEVSM
jgi:hypothetical protein